MKSKKYLMIIVLVVAMLLLGANSSHAVLQANGGTPITQRLDKWLVQIRQMESLGGTLGLTETINTTTLLPTSASNNLDIHMEKNTEYGAIAILSASSYGNPNVMTSGSTTTGNKTGIVLIGAITSSNLYREVVAAHGGEDSYMSKANSKYINLYGKEEAFSTKVGDALLETSGWHGANKFYSAFGRVNDYTHLARGYKEKIFNVTEATANNGRNYEVARAIMICGEGI